MIFSGWSDNIFREQLGRDQRRDSDDDDPDWWEAKTQVVNNLLDEVWGLTLTRPYT